MRSGAREIAGFTLLLCALLTSACGRVQVEPSGGAGAGATASADRAPPSPVVETTTEAPYLRSYRHALELAMRPDEAELLRGVSAAGTADAAPAPLALIATDRAVRVFAPLALVAAGYRADGDGLRRLPELTSERAALAASERISRARRRLAGERRATLDQTPFSLGNVDLALAEAHDAAARVAVTGSGAAHAEKVAHLVTLTLELYPTPDNRAPIVRAAARLFEDLAAAARRGRASIAARRATRPRR